MTRRVHLYLVFVLFPLFLSLSAHAEKSTSVSWTSETHQDHYLDVNGDGVKDLLLRPVLKGEVASLTFGRKHNYQTYFQASDTITLNTEYEEVKWHKKNVRVVTGFFTKDEFEDVVLIHPNKQKAVMLSGGVAGLRFHSEILPDVMPFLDNGKHYEFHVGDFNGDKMDDLLAVDTKEGKHQLYHSFPHIGLNLVQEIDNENQWGLEKSERLYIEDLNADGKDDVFALAKKIKKKHYLIYSDETGLFTDENVEILKAQFADVDWNDERYSTTVTFGDEGPELVRLYNQNGGIGFEGEQEFDQLDPLRFETCKLIYYKLKNKKHGKKCSFKNNRKQVDQPALSQRLSSVNKLAQSKEGAITDRSITNVSNATATSALESANEQLQRLVPNEIVEAPIGSVGAYPAIGQNFTLSWNAVANATKYEIWVSRDKGVSYENTYKSTSQTSYVMNESTAGRRYYYVKACNENGCSGYSPYRGVVVFGIPDVVSSFSPTVSQKQVGESTTLQWQKPNGIIGTGGYYQIQQTAPDGSVTWLPTVNGGLTQSVAVTLSQMGQYKFQIRACNKSNTHCSELSPFEALAATVPAPSSTDAFIRNLTYTPVSMSVGNTQYYSFDYLNSTLCQSSNLKKNGAAIPGSVTYVNSGTPISGAYNWSAQRDEAVTWEFDVSCSNASSSHTQHVVTMINAATQPVLSPDTASVPGGEVAIIRVLENDVDDDGHALTITGYTQPALGSVSCDGEKCQYTAPSSVSSNTVTSFSYTVSDGMTSAVSAQVTVNLTSNLQDPQVIMGGWDSGVTNAREPAGYAPVQVSVGDQQSFGFSYANVRYCENNIGNTYVADNGSLQSGTYSWSAVREFTATWDFTVTCYNNNSQVTFNALANIVDGPAPATEDDFIVVKQHSGAVIWVLENDPDDVNDALVISSVSNATHGTVTIAPDARSITYTPNGNYIGLDSFTYDATRGGLGTPSKTEVFVEVEKSNVDPRILVEYNFNNATNLTLDSSSYGRHGMNHNVSYAQVDGNGVADFSHADSYIVIPDRVTQLQSNTTVSVRFKPTVLSHTQTQVMFNRSIRPTVTSTALQIQTDNSMYFTTYTGTWRNVHYPGPLDSNNWYEVTFSWGSAGQKIYANGTLVGSSTYTGESSYSSLLDTLGDWNTYTGWDFKGYIDSFKVYSTQLSDADIASELAPSTDTVSISGSSSMGATLSSALSLADANMATLTYRWHRDGTPIYGASNSIYTVTEDDIGKTLSVTVSYVTNAGQYKTVSSSTVNVSEPSAVNIVSATFVDGSLVVGADADLTIVFENATKCYDVDDVSQVYHESVSPLSGRLDTVMAARYVTGAGVLRIACENTVGSTQIDVPYDILKLGAPDELSAN